MSGPQQMGFGAARPLGGFVPPDNREDLARGLLLLRASSMNLMRFQLAMERRDRAVALQTVDDLVALDGCLRDFLQDMPAPEGAYAELVREVEEQRASLVREKLTLVAGRMGPAVKREQQPEWAEPAPEPAPPPPPALARGEPTLELGPEAELEPLPRYQWMDEPGKGRFPVVRVALLVLFVAALAAAGVVWWFGWGDEIAARLPL